MRRTLLLPLLFLAAACDQPAPTAPEAARPETPSLSASAENRVVPGHFIVTLQEGTSPQAVAREVGITPRYVYTRALTGFAGAMSEAARGRLLQDARVLRVEPDQTVHASEVQSSPTWGLDRADQRSLPLDGSYTYNQTGLGVTSYVIDTGIRYDHVEFGGRASFGYDAFGGDGSDCQGHGTHVAGTVGGKTYGVAKATGLVAVRVLDCNGSGTISGVIAGIDWVTANRRLPAVANLSLGGGASTSLDDAVRRLISAGVATAVAAGNDGRDACNYSPARVAEALTVGATDKTDTKASWSNYGSCLDFFAPGVGITSAYHSGSTATATMSGTSMAAPHVAGVAALYLETNPGASASAVHQAILDGTTKGVVLSSSSANNHLLYSLLVGGETTTPPPSTGISLTASGYTKKGLRYVDLKWEGATSTSVDVFRNGSKLTTTANDGAHTDSFKSKGGTFKYKVCEAGTSTCSAEASVTF